MGEQERAFPLLDALQFLGVVEGKNGERRPLAMMRSIRFLSLTLAAVAVFATALCQQEVKIGFISLKKISD